MNYSYASRADSPSFQVTLYENARLCILIATEKKKETGFQVYSKCSKLVAVGRNKV